MHHALHAALPLLSCFDHRRLLKNRMPEEVAQDPSMRDTVTFEDKSKKSVHSIQGTIGMETATEFGLNNKKSCIISVENWSTYSIIHHVFLNCIQAEQCMIQLRKVAWLMQSGSKPVNQNPQHKRGSALSRSPTKYSPEFALKSGTNRST